MLAAIEHLMSLHPASHFGRRERGRPDFEIFEELESRPLRRGREYEAERRETTWMLGEVAAAAAMLVVFVGVLTVIARVAGDAPETGEQRVVAVSDSAERR